MFERIAVIGATGAVGSLVRRLLEERDFPCREVKFLASSRSAGQQIEFRGQPVTVETLEPSALDGVQLAIASTPDEVAAEFVPWARERGTIVVDESGYWRMDEDVPLVIPEVNPQAIAGHRGVIASPNCSTTQMVVVMKPLYDAVGIRRVVVSSYQAASGAGVSGEQDLAAGSTAALAGQQHDYQAFAHPLAFNVIPQIGSAREGGYTSEELKMVRETQKIFGDEALRICPTCVRVPVTNCHSESLLIETDRKLSVAEAREILQAAPGIRVVDDVGQGRYPMPIDCSDCDEVFVGRIREDLSSDRGLALWCVSDNLRKGAATNAVQIAELLVNAPSVA